MKRRYVVRKHHREVSNHMRVHTKHFLQLVYVGDMVSPAYEGFAEQGGGAPVCLSAKLPFLPECGSHGYSLVRCSHGDHSRLTKLPRRQQDENSSGRQNQRQTKEETRYRQKGGNDVPLDLPNKPPYTHTNTRIHTAATLDPTGCDGGPDGHLKNESSIAGTTRSRRCESSSIRHSWDVLSGALEWMERLDWKTSPWDIWRAEGCTVDQRTPVNQIHTGKTNGPTLCCTSRMA